MPIGCAAGRAHRPRSASSCCRPTPSPSRRRRRPTPCPPAATSTAPSTAGDRRRRRRADGGALRRPHIRTIGKAGAHATIKAHGVGYWKGISQGQGLRRPAQAGPGRRPGHRRVPGRRRLARRADRAPGPPGARPHPAERSPDHGTHARPAPTRPTTSPRPASACRTRPPRSSTPTPTSAHLRTMARFHRYSWGNCL